MPLFFYKLSADGLYVHTGEATAAKTQICLQLLLSVQTSGREGGQEGSAL